MDTGAKSPKLRSIFWIIAIVLAIWAMVWVFTQEPEHDEVEHWHAAWLMSQGLRPFEDFFEHHTPLLWNLLRIPYTFIGDSYDIIIITRLFILICFIFTATLAYKISRHWSSPEGSWIAALGFPLFSLSLLQTHLYVRGDPLILLLIMFALWLAVMVTDKSTWPKLNYLRMFMIFLALGIAVGISPRAGIPALTLYIVLFLLCLKLIPVHRVLAMFFLGGLIVLIPTLLQALIYGFQQYLFWVFNFSATLFPSFSPLKNLTRLLMAAAPLWFMVGIAIYSFVGKSELRQQRSFWLITAMAVVNFLGLWASNRPYMQHFLMTMPFLGLLAGIGYDRIAKIATGRFKIPNWNWAGFLLMIGIALTVGKSYRLWTGGGLESRAYWVERADWLMEQVDAEATCAAGTAYFQPLFINDSFHYWFAGRYATPTLRNMQPDFQPYSLEDLQSAFPDILHDSFANAWGFKGTAEYQSWLEANYNPTKYDRYWLKKKTADP